MKRPFVTTLLLFGSTLAARDAVPAPSADPAARGLDIFVHAPSQAIAGGRLPIQIQAIGFPTVTKPRPLPGATIVASWDPETLPGRGPRLPDPVSVAADREGLAHLDVLVPPKALSERQATLLLAVRSGAHERVRSVHVEIVPPFVVALDVSDRKVVPGSTISAWASLRSAETGLPAAGTEVEFTLSEGTYVRQRLRAKTGSAGIASARIGIPKIELADYEWKLGVRAPPSQGETATAEQTLTARDETPGEPKLALRWEDDAVEPGKNAGFTVTVRDGVAEPVAGLPLRYRVAPKVDRNRNRSRQKGDDTEVDSGKDEDWDSLSSPGVTDAAGVFHASAPMPSVVSPKGLPMELQVRTTVLGHELSANAEFTLRSTHGPSGKLESKRLEVSVVPETGLVVPDIEQRLVLNAREGNRPVAEDFEIEGDGLSARVRTNALGFAEIAWTPPKTVGARHVAGNCAMQTAAEVSVRPLSREGRLERLCLDVSRDSSLLLKLAHPVVRAGEPVSLRILGKTDRGVSLIAKAHETERSVSRWVAAGTRDADLTLPPDAKGLWTISAVVPGENRAARTAPAVAVLVVPTRLPRLIAKRHSGGRIAPGGTVVVDAELADGHGRAMPGTVSALLVDANGGRDPFGLAHLDTRESLASAFVDKEKRDAFLESDDPDFEPLRRNALHNASGRPVLAELDPAARVTETLDKAFETVVHALEGAVRECTEDPERVDDVRREGPHGWEINPEITAVIRDALDDSVTTPGGEPITLSDIRAVDPQVDFDHAARRITRHKLLQVLTRVRSYVHEHKLSRDEPIPSDPNAILRFLVREGPLESKDMLDPWGGTFRFVPDHGSRVPFLSLIPGYELHAPGPDRKVGTADDIRDPFARVVKSGTPYANAVREDEIVDARWKMDVSDATVEGWTSLFDELTGQTISGEGHGVGLGSGQGFGSGHGRLGASHTTRAPAVRVTSELSPYTHWLSPIRTDAKGRARMSIPLGPIETTWEIWLVGIPDGGLPAVTSLEIPTQLAISARADAGGVWTEGDRGNVVVTLRNRTERPTEVVVTAEPRANLVLESAHTFARTATIPAGGARAVHVPVRATRAGDAALAVTVQSPGTVGDSLVHEWPIRYAGERVDVTNTVWVDSTSKIGIALEPIVRPVGQPRVVLERSHAGTATTILESMNPDRFASASSLADTIDTAGRIRYYFLGHGGEAHRTTVLANDLLARAAARLRALVASPRADGRDPVILQRAIGSSARWLSAEDSASIPIAKRAECPAEEPGSLRERSLLLDLLPVANQGSTLACWDAFLATTMDRLQAESDPVAIALAILALAEHPGREPETKTLVRKLRELSVVRPSGEIVLPPAYYGDRAARSEVLAALLQTASLVPGLAAPPNRIASWLAVQRDAGGGFGSTEATRSAVRALLPLAEFETPPANVRVSPIGTSATGTAVGRAVGAAIGTARDEVRSEAGRTVRVDALSSQVVPLEAGTKSVQVQTDVPGVIVRFEQPVVRSWANPPTSTASPLQVEVHWPTTMRASGNGRLEVSLRHGLSRKTRVHVRIPLPPGVVMSERVPHARQVHGTILVVTDVDASAAPTGVYIPIRYALSGRFTAPEVVAYIEDGESTPAYAPARPIVVE